MRFRWLWPILVLLIAPLAARAQVTVALKESVRSGRAKVGQAVAFETTQEATVGGRLLPKGTPVHGTVAESRGAGAFGRAGKLRLTVEYALLDDGTRVPLSGTLDGRGRSQSTAANVSAVLVGGTLTVALVAIHAFADAWDGGHRSSSPAWLLIGGGVGYLVGHLWRGSDITLPAGRLFIVDAPPGT